jgi:hypothetical protein
MKRVIIAIFAYCCLMTAGMVAMLCLDVSTSNTQAKMLAQVQQNLADIRQKADAVQLEFDDLARQQRQHRSQLSGENAIVVSQAVQQLSAELNVLRQQEAMAAAAVTSNADMLEQIQLRLVPHIAFLMLHSLAIWLFWPWRVFEARPIKPREDPNAKWTPKKR